MEKKDGLEIFIVLLLSLIAFPISVIGVIVGYCVGAFIGGFIGGYKILLILRKWEHKQ